MSQSIDVFTWSISFNRRNLLMEDSTDLSPDSFFLRSSKCECMVIWWIFISISQIFNNAYLHLYIQSSVYSRKEVILCSFSGATKGGKQLLLCRLTLWGSEQEVKRVWPESIPSLSQRQEIPRIFWHLKSSPGFSNTKAIVRFFGKDLSSLGFLPWGWIDSFLLQIYYGEGEPAWGSRYFRCCLQHGYFVYHWVPECLSL